MAILSIIPAAAQTLPAAPTTAPATADTMDPPGWSSVQIAAEQARCTHLLRDADVSATALSPIKDHECGAPAPLQLNAVGRAPQVTFSPPITVTCDLAVALAHWVKSEMQPLARKYLGSPIVRIDTMSSYSCRTAYGRKNAKLSEHGHANAADLRSFTTGSGVTASVLEDWGPTGREIAEQVAAAKKDAALLSVQTAKGPASLTTGSVVRGPGAAGGNRVFSSEALSGVPAIRLGLPNGVGAGIGFNGSAPSHLGGPVAQGGPDSATKMQFLRALHDSACRIFGTTLGPEANSAHRNHFHVDMAERRVKLICE